MKLMLLLVSTLATATSVMAGVSTPLRGPERVVLRTTAGDLLLAFYPEIAPRHVEQVLRLVDLGAYDGTTFFRVEPDVAAQLSDVQYRQRPLSDRQRDTSRPLEVEPSDVVPRRGVLVMHRQAGTLDSGSSFSILLADAPERAGEVTVIGRLESGFDVLNEMLQVPRGDHFRPAKSIEVYYAEVVAPEQSIDELSLAGPRQRSVNGASGGVMQLMLWSLILILVLSIANFTLGSRMGVQVHRSLAMLVALIGGFALLVYFGPSSELNHMHAILMMVAILAILKMTSRFESRAATPPIPKRAEDTAVTPNR